MVSLWWVEVVNDRVSKFYQKLIANAYLAQPNPLNDAATSSISSHWFRSEDGTRQYHIVVCRETSLSKPTFGIVLAVYIVHLCRERLVETGDHRSWSWCRSQHRRLTAVQFTWQSSPRCRFCLASLSSLRWMVCHACAGSIHTASRFSLKFQLPIGVWRRLGANHGLYGLYDCRCHMYCFHMPPNSIHFKLGKHCASPWWSKVSEHHHIISHASIRDERHYKSMNKGKKKVEKITSLVSHFVIYILLQLQLI